MCITGKRSFIAGKCVNVVNTKGENINICWSPDGNTIAVGNKVRLCYVFIKYYNDTCGLEE